MQSRAFLCKGESRQLSQKAPPRPQQRKGQRNVSMATEAEAGKPETRLLTPFFLQGNVKAVVLQEAKARNHHPQQMNRMHWAGCLVVTAVGEQTPRPPSWAGHQASCPGVPLPRAKEDKATLLCYSAQRHAKRWEADPTISPPRNSDPEVKSYGFLCAWALPRTL